jgi:hypothetical protein
MQLRIRRRHFWLALNIVGVCLYLWSASSLWVRPGEESEPGGPADALLWLFTVFPILIAFVGLNLVVLLTISRRIVGKHQRLTAFAVWLTVAAMWVGVFEYDQHRLVRHINAEFSLADEHHTGTHHAQRAKL